MNRQVQRLSICVLNISPSTILTVAGAVSIIGGILAGHLVVLITKFPASFRHSVSYPHICLLTLRALLDTELWELLH